MFRYPKPLIVALALLVAAVGTANVFGQNSELPLQAGQDAQAETANCLKIIQSKDASDNDKAIAFKRLAVFGTKYAVPALAPVLEDPKWAHYARYSLEPLPDPSVDETFRAALGKLQGRLLVGVINSIGVRQDPEAVEALAKLLDQDDAIVAAATAALGKIANKEAVAILKEQLAKTKGPLKIQVADACLDLRRSAPGRWRQGRGPRSSRHRSQSRRASVCHRGRHAERDPRPRPGWNQPDG